jgi:hypothetical protein
MSSARFIEFWLAGIGLFRYGFRVRGSEFRVLGSGFKVPGVRCQLQGVRFQPSRRPKKRPVKSKKKLMNIERPTSNAFCQFKKGCAKRNHPSKFSVFKSRLHHESLIYKSMKRSVINIRRSMLGVRCSMFNIFTVPTA